jgi:GT2 family glycosyltransferase
VNIQVVNSSDEKILNSTIVRNAPSVTVIILNYNCQTFLANCIESLLLTNYSNLKIVLVDNNSEDRSLELVKQQFGEKIQILSLDKNYGFSKGNNFGAANKNSDYLVFLNPDTKVHPNWLHYLISTMERDSKIGIAQPKLLQMNGKLIDSTGGFIDSQGLVWNRGHNEKDLGQYDKSSNIFYAKGAALIIRNDLWLKLKGFDPLFFVYYEETDLCWRAWENGYKVAYVPNAVVYHASSGVLKKVPEFVKYNEAKGRLLVLLKHYSKNEIVKNCVILIIFHSLNTLRQFTKGNMRSGLAILSGTLWCLTNLRKILESRQAVYSNDIIHFSPSILAKSAYFENHLFF